MPTRLLREPLVELPDGQILDGRNRYRACQIAGVEPRFETYHGDDLVAFVVSLNLKRRHLDESQRAMVAAGVENYERGRPAQKDANWHLFETPSPPIDRATVAEMLNVSPRSIARAAVVRQHGSAELIEAVERGKASVSAAAEVASRPKPTQKEIVALGEAEIIRAANAIKRDRKEAKRAVRTAAIQAAAATVPPVTTRYEIHHGSCADAVMLPAQSVDFIITDPPYPREFLPVFDDLAAIAAHVLKPDGLALVMVGESYQMPATRQRDNRSVARSG